MGFVRRALNRQASLSGVKVFSLSSALCSHRPCGCSSDPDALCTGLSHRHTHTYILTDTHALRVTGPIFPSHEAGLTEALDDADPKPSTIAEKLGMSRDPEFQKSP